MLLIKIKKLKFKKIKKYTINNMKNNFIFSKIKERKIDYTKTHKK